MHQNLAQKAFVSLEEKIVNLKLIPGEVYSEEEISNLLEVSRTPLREALLKMETYDLVEMIPRLGVKITKIGFNRQLAIQETKKALDLLVFSSAARRANKEEREKLINLADRIISIGKAKKRCNYFKLDQEFNNILDQACRNDFASHALIPLRIHTRRLLSYIISKNDENEMNNYCLLQEKIIRAITDGDEKMVEQTSSSLIDHLNSYTRELLELR